MHKPLRRLQAGRERAWAAGGVLTWRTPWTLGLHDVHEHTEESSQTGGRRIDGWTPPVLHAGATKLSTLQVGQKCQKGRHINPHSTKWERLECVCYWLCQSLFWGLNNMGPEHYDLTACWDCMKPDIQNPVMTERAHQSSYYLLLCWHPQSITRLLILNKLSINREAITNSIIKERTMFWSCWVDNKGAAISHLPPHPPTMAPSQIAFATKECIVG